MQLRLGVIEDDLDAEFCTLRAGYRDLLIERSLKLNTTACIYDEGKSGICRAFLHRAQSENHGWLYVEGPQELMRKFVNHNREPGSVDEEINRGAEIK